MYKVKSLSKCACFHWLCWYTDSLQKQVGWSHVRWSSLSVTIIHWHTTFGSSQPDSVLPCVLAHQSRTPFWWSYLSSLLPFYCHVPPSQVLLKEIKCWTCCFEALRFSLNKWLLAASSCLICPVSNQGHRHWMHQRCSQRPSLPVPEKVEIETTLSWILLEVWHLSRWHPQRYQAWAHAPSNSAATTSSPWCQRESCNTGFSPGSLSAARK